MNRHPVTHGFLLAAALATVGCGSADDGLGSAAQAVDTGPLVARPASADFGAVTVGTTATRSVTLTNTGREVVDVTNVSVTSNFPPDPCRAVVLQPCFRPGDTTTLEITCSPTTATDFSGRVAITYHVGSGYQVLSVPVAGVGATAPRR